MYNEVTVWSNQPDYEEYRQVLEEDLPWMSESERSEYFMQANTEGLEFQREEMSMDLESPIFEAVVESGEDGIRSYFRPIGSTNLADCFVADKGLDKLRWYVDGKGDLRCEERRGELENRRLYRVLAESAAGAAERMTGRMKSGKLSIGEFLSSTRRLGDAVSKVYGLEFDD